MKIERCVLQFSVFSPLALDTSYVTEHPLEMLILASKLSYTLQHKCAATLYKICCMKDLPQSVGMMFAVVSSEFVVVGETGLH